MGDAKNFTIESQRELVVHCLHDLVSFHIYDWAKGFNADIAIPWGAWAKAIEVSTPQRAGDKLLIGEALRGYISIMPVKPGVLLEAAGGEPRVFAEFLIPWEVWEEVLKWIEGPGKSSIAGHTPGIVEKEEKYEIRVRR